MSRADRRVLAVAIVSAVIAAMYVCTGFWFPGIELPFYLLIGWIRFLGRVVPTLRVRWDVVVSTVVYLVLLVVGAHLFLRWLYREARDTAAGSGQRRVWRLRWTLGGLTAVLLMFVAGTAAVGIVHQSVWLARSPKRMYRPGMHGAYRIRCGSNLRQIGYGLELYANEHGDRYPDDLATLVRSGIDLTSDVIICPSSSDEMAQGATPEAVAAEMLKPGHCSYVYFGKGLTRPVDPKRVVAVDRAENHADLEGMNVLFGDGRVDWLDAPKAEALLKELAPAPTSKAAP